MGGVYSIILSVLERKLGWGPIPPPPGEVEPAAAEDVDGFVWDIEDEACLQFSSLIPLLSWGFGSEVSQD